MKDYSLGKDDKFILGYEHLTLLNSGYVLKVNYADGTYEYFAKTLENENRIIENMEAQVKHYRKERDNIAYEYANRFKIKV